MKFKRGELTTQQIVMIVVLIASFAIILFFLFRLNLGNETESQICHNSVVMRGNSVLSNVPLNCKTEYICISKNGDCNGMKSSEVVKVKDLEGVYEVLADSMADCWWTFGEGKINYVGADMKRNHYCSICSKIEFDKDIIGIKGLEKGEIDKETFYKEYLNKTNISSSNKQTYSEYLFGTNDIDKLKSEISSVTQEAGTTFGKINTDKQYYVIMGIVSDVSVLDKVAEAGVAGAIVWKVASKFFWVKTAVVMGVIGWTTYATIHTPEVLSIMRQGDGIDNTFMVPTIIEADSDKFKSLNCEDVNTLA